MRSHTVFERGEPLLPAPHDPVLPACIRTTSLATSDPNAILLNQFHLFGCHRSGRIRALRLWRAPVSLHRRLSYPCPPCPFSLCRCSTACQNASGDSPLPSSML